jgi:hypothetical protein
MYSVRLETLSYYTSTTLGHVYKNHVRSRLDPVEAMMSDCYVKDERGRRELIVLSARQDDVILHLHVSAFVSDSSRLFVNLYAVAKGREERRELLQDLRSQQSTHLVHA